MRGGSRALPVITTGPSNGKDHKGRLPLQTRPLGPQDEVIIISPHMWRVKYTYKVVCICRVEMDFVCILSIRV